MKVLVIGGNGFIGSRVVRTLLEEGHTVRCMLREQSKTHRLEGLSYERHAGDIRDAKTIEQGLAGCDAVIHMASPSAWRDINSPALDDVVLGGTRNVLDAARAQGQVRVVFCSTAIAVNASNKPEVFDERTPFGVTDRSLRYSHAKHAAEKMCLEAASEGTPVVIVNPGEVYGPEDTDMITAANLVDFAKSNPVLVCHGGSSIAHVDDVALGVVRALERGRSGERYILGGDNLSVYDLAALALRILNRKAKIITVPTGLLKTMTRTATALRIPLPFEPAVVPYATRYWFMDNRKAQDELGVQFRPAPETLEPTLRWLQQAGHIPV